MEWFEKLVRLREEQDINQGDFSKILGTSQKELSLLESGKKAYLPKWYMNYLLKENYDFNSLFNPDLTLRKQGVEIASLSKDKKQVLDLLEKLDRGHIVFFVRDRLDYFKSLEEFQDLILEASARLKGADYEKRLKRLEAVTATLLLELERKSGAPLFSENDNAEPNP